MRLSYFKKILILIAATIAVSLSGVSVLKAQGGVEALLQQIVINTGEILKRVDNLPPTLELLSEMALNWTQPDKSDATATFQGSFTELGKLLLRDSTTQTQDDMRKQINGDLFGPTVNATNMPYANDLVYYSVLGTPYFSPDPRNTEGAKTKANPVYNYLKNATGIGLNQIPPGIDWQGTPEHLQQYINYYSAVKAVESFGAYVLSNQYADGNQFNTLQQKLITQASDPKAWLAAISAENIGIVLRQILLFQSQAFILLTQLVQTQKQMVTAQVMTNTLLIANNSSNEKLMVANAQNVKPTL